VEAEFVERFAMARRVHVRPAMQQVELQERLRRALNQVESLPPVSGGRRGQQLRRALLTAAKQACDGYRDVCVSASPEQFIERIAFVARRAKRATATLVLIVQLDYIDIAQVRELVIELRTLERILTVSRNTARRRQQRRLTSGPRRCTT
jgi:hypothetical protein